MVHPLRESALFKGAWIQGKFAYYDEVTHNGSSWYASIRMEQHQNRRTVIRIGLSASRKVKTVKMEPVPRLSVNGTLIVVT